MRLQRQCIFCACHVATQLTDVGNRPCMALQGKRVDSGTGARLLYSQPEHSKCGWADGAVLLCGTTFHHFSNKKDANLANDSRNETLIQNDVLLYARCGGEAQRGILICFFGGPMCNSGPDYIYLLFIYTKRAHSSTILAFALRSDVLCL